MRVREQVFFWVWHRWVCIQSSPPPFSYPPSFLSHACESLPCTISGEGEGKRQINKISFQSLCSQREIDGRGGSRQKVFGGSAARNWKLLPLPGEICVHYLQSQTNRRRVQVYVCVCATGRKPPCLSSLITVLCSWSELPLALFTYVSLRAVVRVFLSLCVHVCMIILPLCVCFPHGCQGWIPRST